MLGIDFFTVVSWVSMGALAGSLAGAFAVKQTNRENLQMIEDYWNSDIKRLESKITRLEYLRGFREASHLSPDSVGKFVNNTATTCANEQK